MVFYSFHSFAEGILEGIAIYYIFSWILSENILNLKWIEKSFICTFFKDCYVYYPKTYVDYINRIAKHDSAEAIFLVILIYLIFGYNFLWNFYQQAIPEPKEPVFDRSSKANSIAANNVDTIYVRSGICNEETISAPFVKNPKMQLPREPLISHVRSKSTLSAIGRNIRSPSRDIFHDESRRNSFTVFPRNNETLLTKHLSNCIASLTHKAEDESKQILAKDVYFYDIEKLLLYCYNLNSDNITKFQTKVKLTSNIRNNSMICTIIDYDVIFLTLKLRHGSRFKPNEKETFTVTLHPNIEELEFAKEGYQNICKNGAMLKKLWAYDTDFENPERFSSYSFSKSELYKKIEAGTKIHSSPVLICAKRKCDIEKFGRKLKNEIPLLFQRHWIVYIVTIKRPGLPEFTKILDDSINLQSFKIILCTIGVVPKIIKRCRLAKNYFKQIFIIEAEKVNELDCWMVIGHAANINIKIFICGNYKNDRRTSSCSSYDQQETNTTNDNSMFYRLCKKEVQVSHTLNKNEIIVFEL